MKRGTPRHPKTLALAKVAGISVPTAIGHLELLWHFTAEFAPQGDIGRYEIAYIEAAILWKGARGKLINSMREVGWIDPPPADQLPTNSGATTEQLPTYSLVVHDWVDHCDEATRKRLQRAGLSFVELTDELTGHRQPSRARDIHKPEPEPVPVAVPDPAPAAHTKEERVTPAPTKDAAVADRFTAWFALYRGRKANPNGAAQAWLSLVTAETVDAAFACTIRYNESAEVGRGVCMEAKKFIETQADANWLGTWQKTAPRPETANERRRRETIAGLKAMRGKGPGNA